MSDDNKVKETTEALEVIARAVPVYQDAVQPAARQVGQALETVAKSIHIALAPISALVWGYEHISDFLSTRVAEKLKDVPPSNIETPDPSVAGPALEALRYTGHQEALREMYANLLATSLDAQTARAAHPSFVEMIRNMSPDEAKIMLLFASRRTHPVVDLQSSSKDKTGYIVILAGYSHVGHLAGCDHPDLTPTYLNNLDRLGLVEIQEGHYITAPGTYEPLEGSTELDDIRARILQTPGREPLFDRKVVTVTPLGLQFIRACVLDKRVQRGVGDPAEHR